MQLQIGDRTVQFTARQLFQSIVYKALRPFLPDEAFTIFGGVPLMRKAGLSQIEIGDARRFLAAFRSLCYACIDARAKDVATAVRAGSLKLYKKVGQSLESVPEHPIYDLLERPNPSFTRWYMWYLIETYLCIFGNAYIWLKLKNDVPVAMWLLPSGNVRIIPGDPRKGEDIIVGYSIVWNDRTVQVPEHEIIHLRLPNPSDPYFYGQSLMHKAAVEIDIDQFIGESQRDFFALGGVPGGVVTFPEVLDERQRQFFKDMFLESFQGRPGQIGVLEGGASYTPIINQRELDYLQSRGINRKTIQAVFGVPDSRLGFSEQITATATMETVDAVYLRSTIEPELTLIDEQLTLDFVKKYYGDEYVLKHESVVPKDVRRQKELDKLDLEMGRVSINYLNERDGLPLVDGGDEPLVSMNLVPLSSVAGQRGDTSGSLNAATGADAEKGLLMTEEQKRATWRKANALRERWRRKVQAEMRAYILKLRDDAVKTILSSKKQAVNHFSFDLDNWIRLLMPIVRRQSLAMLREGFEEFIERHRIDNMLWAPNIPAVQDAVAFLAQKTKTVPQSLLTDLMQELDEGIAQGETVQQLAQRAGRFFDMVVDYRAMRIARTNSVAAINTGNQIAAKRSRIFKTKMWLSMRDDRVRDGHYELDGTRIGIDEQFLEPATGDRLDYPGDPKALDGASVINCRCVLIYGK